MQGIIVYGSSALMLFTSSEEKLTTNSSILPTAISSSLHFFFKSPDNHLFWSTFLSTLEEIFLAYDDPQLIRCSLPPPSGEHKKIEAPRTDHSVATTCIAFWKRKIFQAFP